MTDRPADQPTDKQTDRFIGKLHFQIYAISSFFASPILFAQTDRQTDRLIGKLHITSKKIRFLVSLLHPYCLSAHIFEFRGSQGRAQLVCLYLRVGGGEVLCHLIFL